MGFIKIYDLPEVSVGTMKMFKVGEKEYLVANVNGNYYAMGTDAPMPTPIFRKANWKATL